MKALPFQAGSFKWQPATPYTEERRIFCPLQTTCADLERSTIKMRGALAARTRAAFLKEMKDRKEARGESWTDADDERYRDWDDAAEEDDDDDKRKKKKLRRRRRTLLGGGGGSLAPTNLPDPYLHCYKVGRFKLDPSSKAPGFKNKNNCFQVEHGF